jgi:hypothetical protein
MDSSFFFSLSVFGAKEFKGKWFFFDFVFCFFYRRTSDSIFLLFCFLFEQWINKSFSFSVLVLQLKNG